MTDTPIFLTLKAATYRVYSSTVSFLIAWLIVGKVDVALTIGMADFVVKIATYMLFDVLWTRLVISKRQPKVLWLTGLSGAGKTTIANELVSRLSKTGPTILLDGDELRKLFPNTGFDKVSRILQAERTAQLAAYLEKAGNIVVVSLISPYQETRDYARSICSNFYEVYVATPLKICEERDPKGLYAKVRAGEIKNFTGVDDPYEEPMHPDVYIQTSDFSVKECANKILNETKPSKILQDMQDAISRIKKLLKEDQ